jgi:hypothetical protein
MEATIQTETYSVKGTDETGLIPDGVSSVSIVYGKDGREIRHVYCGYDDLFMRHMFKGEALSQFRSRILRFNNEEKSSEEKEKIVGLLKKLT